MKFQNKINQGGSGIGLAFSKKICELLKGQISFDSEKGKGTTFNIILETSKDINHKPSNIISECKSPQLKLKREPLLPEISDIK
jgi:hypothetical protein